MTIETAKRLFDFYVSSGQSDNARDMRLKLVARGFEFDKEVENDGKHKKREGAKK